MRSELVTTLKRKATDIIARVAGDKEPVLITQHGTPAAYLVDVETFTAMTERIAILEGIARGEKAILEKRVVSHSRAKAEDGPMAQIVWTEPALEDLDRIADYISLDKPDAAANLVRRVFARVSQLAKFPRLGSGPPELPGTAHSHLVVPPVRIFYRSERNAVYIVHILRSERLLDPDLLR